MEKRTVGLIAMIVAMGIGTTGAAVHESRIDPAPRVEQPVPLSLAKRARQARRFADPAPVTPQPTATIAPPVRSRTIKSPPTTIKTTELSRISRRQA